MPVFQHDYHSETFGTEITEVIPPVAGLVARVTTARYKPAATPHNLYFMRAVAQSTVSVQGVAATTTLTLADPSAMKNVTTGAAEALAADDWVIYQLQSGIYEAGEVQSLNGSIITLFNNVSDVVLAGAPIWYLGELARATQLKFLTEASVVNEYLDLAVQGGIPGQLDEFNTRTGAGDPMLFISDNITATGALRMLGGHYVGTDDYTMT